MESTVTVVVSSITQIRKHGFISENVNRSASVLVSILADKFSFALSIRSMSIGTLFIHIRDYQRLLETIRDYRRLLETTRNY